MNKIFLKVRRTVIIREDLLEMSQAFNLRPLLNSENQVQHWYPMFCEVVWIRR